MSLDKPARIAIVYSTRDPAGKGSARKLLELAGNDQSGSACYKADTCFKLYGNAVLAGYTEETINMEFLDETPDPAADAIIVISRHRAEAGRRSLTVHHTGNPTSRTLGGEPFKLAVSYPQLAKTLFIYYREAAEETGLIRDYEVVLEATHHGPTRPRKPVVFIEIGSGPEDWVNEKAHETLAIALLKLLERRALVDCEPVSGYGGGHYPIKFTKVMYEDKYCLGHIIPKYAFKEGIPRDVIVQSLTNTYPYKPRRALIEKKSLRSSDRKNLLEVLDENEVEPVMV